MIDPHQNPSPEDARKQLIERWESDEAELEAEDWEYHLGGPDHDYEVQFFEEPDDSETGE
jgi:hypothetical protein